MQGRKIDSRRTKYRPGTISNQLPIHYANEDPARRDRENRLNVVERIGQLIEEGKDLDEAVNILLSDNEIKRQFHYLESQGIDLANSFKGWYNGTKKREKFKDNFYNRGSLTENAAKINDYR